MFYFQELDNYIHTTTPFSFKWLSQFFEFFHKFRTGGYFILIFIFKTQTWEFFDFEKYFQKPKIQCYKLKQNQRTNKHWFRVQTLDTV